MLVAIVGGGIGGLSLALALENAGIPCRIFEAVPEIKPLGVGLNLLPHAVTGLSRLGLLPALLERGVETQDINLFTAHGQAVHRESRGRHDGYAVPQISIHRGDLQETLLEAVRERLGDNVLELDRRCTGVTQDGASATARFVDASGRESTFTSDIVIACDGIHSAVRRQLHPEGDQYCFYGTVQFRGVTRQRPFLSGRSMAYVGTPKTGKLVAYPIRENIDANGSALINWVIEVSRPDCGVREWNRRAAAEDFVGLLETWRFDWLDVPAMIRNADAIYEYPVIDRDPLTNWTVGRVSLLGDAAHPMLPRGSNGAAQAIIDGQTLAECLASNRDPVAALRAYEDVRRPATTKIVLTNRDRAPDAILSVLEQRTDGKSFKHLHDFLSTEEIAQWQESYKQVAGFSKALLNAAVVQQ